MNFNYFINMCEKNENNIFVKWSKYKTCDQKLVRKYVETKYVNGKYTKIVEEEVKNSPISLVDTTCTIKHFLK